jgi:hypothetical protein
MMEYPLREFINVYAYRGCSMFQWEIVMVMRMARDILVGLYPFLEPYVKISCEKTQGAIDIKFDANLDHGFDREQIAHTCTFQGWENVEAVAHVPMERGRAIGSLRSEHHRIENASKKA